MGLAKPDARATEKGILCSFKASVQCCEAAQASAVTEEPGVSSRKRRNTGLRAIHVALASRLHQFVKENHSESI